MNKETAIRLIRETITEFERIRQYRRIKYLDGDYHVAYTTMKRLLSEFLSPGEMSIVKHVLDVSTDSIINSDNSDASMSAFCEHCSYCIAQLRSCEVKIKYLLSDLANGKGGKDHVPDYTSSRNIPYRNNSILKYDAIQLIDKYSSQLIKSKSLPSPKANPDYDAAIHGISIFLAELFGELEATNFLDHITPSADLVKSSSELAMVSHYFCLHIDTCIALLEVYKDKIQYLQNKAEHGGRIIPTTDKVFVIHGHDETNLLKVRTLLRERYALNPIVLNEQAGKGRTIIEKFEEEASDAAFAIAVITPDDLIEAETGEYLQARPNVIFEIGWFYGRLGRERVCIILKKGTKIHSDLDGISRIEFKTSVEEKINEIAAELVAAGLISQLV